MKKVLCLVAFLVLAAQLPVWGYDTSPSDWQILPEAIWAPATGGGTWVTELQITNLSQGPITVTVYFDSAGDPASFGVDLGPIPALNSVKYSNILATLDALDPTTKIYYGQVGALFINVVSGGLFQIQGQTVNGNYGKTFPGLNVVEGNTAGESRPMMIQGLVKNATYRTFAGVYNSSGSYTYTLRFTIVDATGAMVGNYFDRTVAGYGFLSFNVFTQAAAPPGDYDNCWLYIEVLSGGSAAEAPMLFGSIANNYTNDTYALLAKQYSAPVTVAPAPIRH